MKLLLLGTGSVYMKRMCEFELYSGMVSDQLSIYIATINSRMNEVMNVLTLFASIFIPLTFFAGIYGMNFKYFPELEYKYLYPIFWLAALLICTGLLIFFRKKKWFNRKLFNYGYIFY